MGYGGQVAMTSASLSGPIRRRGGKGRTRRRDTGAGPLSPAIYAAIAMARDLLAVTVGLLAAGMLSGQTAQPPTAKLLAVLAVTVGFVRRDYAVDTVLGQSGHGMRALETWLVAVALASLGRAIKGTASCAIDVPTVMTGALVLPLTRAVLGGQGRRWARAGRMAARRVMLVGGAADIEAFVARRPLQARGLRLVGTAVLRDEPGTLADDLVLAVATSRIRQPDDVILLLPWCDTARVRRCIEALRLLPAAIHLGPPDVPGPDRPGADAAAGMGVPLVLRPLSAAQRRLKRGFDLVAASAALLLIVHLSSPSVKTCRMASPLDLLRSTAPGRCSSGNGEPATTGSRSAF